MFSTFQLGVCYYPEHWPADVHESDLRRIKSAGFDFVRLGEGAWNYFEPEEGRFQFDLFDRAINLCRKIGLKVIFGTPTYVGPAWISHKYPEVLRWNFDRLPMTHGTRRHFNYTSPKYLELSDRICTALAERYAKEPAIVGWQLDNEFNCHMDVSYAPSDTLEFQRWLKKKYRTLDNLNRSWGTNFWAQTYDAWEEIDLPHPGAASPYYNPSQRLDESRFISDCVIRFAKRQADILRKSNKRWFITHNGLFHNVNGPALVRELDFFSHDQYPLFWSEWAKRSEPLVQARSLSFPFGILEQQSGPGGQMTYLQATPRPGELQLWAWQSVAHGAKFVSFFRWRTCPYGSEQHWHGLLDQDSKDTRRLAEAKSFGEQARRLPKDFFDAAPLKFAAVLRDFDNEANERTVDTYTKPQASEHSRWMVCLARRHIPVDFTWPEASWTGYKFLILPHQKIVTPTLAKKLAEFVKAGGTLILGAQSGLKNANNHIVEQTPPGLLTKLAGIEVEDWTTLAPLESRKARIDDGPEISFGTFVERLRPITAKPLAYWDQGDSLLASAPAITRNSFGKGVVIYIGGYASETSIDALLDALINTPHLPGDITVPPDVEVILRQSGKHRYTVLLNHSALPQGIANLSKTTDLLTGESLSTDFTLAPHRVLILKSKS